MVRAMSSRTPPPLALLTAGATAAFGSRTLLQRLLLGKFRRDVRVLNAGDHRSLRVLGVEPVD